MYWVGASRNPKIGCEQAIQSPVFRGMFISVWGGGVCFWPHMQQLDVRSQFPDQGWNPGGSSESTDPNH